VDHGNREVEINETFRKLFRSKMFSRKGAKAQRLAKPTPNLASWHPCERYFEFIFASFALFVVKCLVAAEPR